MKMKKQKRGDIQWDKLIAFILIFVAVIIGIFIAINFKTIQDKIGTFLPSFVKTNYTPPDYQSCPIESTYVGFVFNDYININEEKTNFYIKDDFIWMDDGSRMTKDKKVGSIHNGSLTIVIPGTPGEAENYGKLYPDADKIKLLRKSFLGDSGALCAKNTDFSVIQSEKSCVLTCELAEGVCSSSPIIGKMAYKQFNCASGQICYVNPNERKLNSSGGLSLDGAFLRDEKGSDVNIRDLDSLSLSISDVMGILVGINYPYSSDTSICYAFDSDSPDYTLSKGYIGPNGDIRTLFSNRFSFSGNKFINFIFWDTKKNEKIIQRWKLETKSNSLKLKKYYIYYDGWIDSQAGEINNGNVKLSVSDSDKTEELYVLENSFFNDSQGKFFLKDAQSGKVREDAVKFTIKKEGDNLKIYDSSGNYINYYLTLKQDSGKGEIIKNDEFMSKIVGASPKSEFYVIGLSRSFQTSKNSGGYVSMANAHYFKIVKDSVKSISIYADDTPSNKWQKLNCNDGSLISWGIDISKISVKLSDTLDQHCSWGS